MKFLPIEMKSQDVGTLYLATDTASVIMQTYANLSE